MKRKIVSLTVLFLIGIVSVFAAPKAETFRVEGKCGMCKARIEKTSLAIDGVSEAEWNQETKMLKVIFDDSKVKVEDIRKKLAEAGHDNGKYKADDKVYNALPVCCHYRE